MICAAHRYASYSLSLPDRYDGVTSLSVRGKTYRVTNLHTYWFITITERHDSIPLLAEAVCMQKEQNIQQKRRQNNVCAHAQFLINSIKQTEKLFFQFMILLGKIRNILPKSRDAGKERKKISHDCCPHGEREMHNKHSGSPWVVSCCCWMPSLLFACLPPQLLRY